MLTDEEYYEAMQEYAEWLDEREREENLIQQWEEQNNG